MLTNEERARFREEEIFRHEVRASLDTPRNSKQRAWKFLNSPLGLWMLSSVVVALLTWGFSQWQSSAAENVTRQRMTARLDVEIASRLRAGEDVIREAITNEQLYLGIVIINGGADHLNFDFGVFPEFRRRTMQSLLYELRSVIKNDHELGSINAALDAAGDVQAKFIEALNLMMSLNDLDKQVPEEKERELLSELLGRFSAERWRRRPHQSTI